MATRKDARESEQQQQQQQSQGGRQQAAGSGETSRSGEGTASSGNVSDRERSLRTSREGGRGQGLSRRSELGTQSGNYVSPFGLMRQFSDQMDQLFQSVGLGPLGLLPLGLSGRELRGAPARLESRLWAPQVELFQRGDQLVVRADLPGLSPDDVHVDVEDDVLTIEGERRNEYESGGEEQGFYRTERSYGSFFRAIPLPEGVNPEEAQASFQDGVLEVTVPLPKEEKRRARRIPVSAQSSQSRIGQSQSSQSQGSQPHGTQAKSSR